MWLLDFLHSSARFVPKWLAADSWLSLKTAASDMEGVWLGRVINTELSTTAIVENEVTSGVAKILAHQKSHMNEVAKMLFFRSYNSHCALQYLLLRKYKHNSARFHEHFCTLPRPIHTHVRKISSIEFLEAMSFDRLLCHANSPQFIPICICCLHFMPLRWKMALLLDLLPLRKQSQQQTEKNELIFFQTLMIAIFKGLGPTRGARHFLSFVMSGPW